METAVSVRSSTFLGKSAFNNEGAVGPVLVVRNFEARSTHTHIIARKVMPAFFTFISAHEAPAQITP